MEGEVAHCEPAPEALGLPLVDPAYHYHYADGDDAKIAETRRTIDAIQREFYGTPGPAVTAIRVSGFAFEDLLIEIEAMAVCRE